MGEQQGPGKKTSDACRRKSICGGKIFLGDRGDAERKEMIPQSSSKKDDSFFQNVPIKEGGTGAEATRDIGRDIG